jgi:hypothetical protein
MTRSATVTRRDAVRLLTAGGLAATRIALAARAAAAGRSWSRRDPVVMIDGQTVDIWLESYAELSDTATGPAKLVIDLPRGVSGRLLATDLGFGGPGYDVRFRVDDRLRSSWSKLDVRVATYVPSSNADLPLSVCFQPRSSALAAAKADGQVNRWLTIRTQ